MEQLIQQLKVILGTNFALYLKSHNYHWNIEGSNFPQYHEFLQNIYEELFTAVDVIAEHIRQLDGYTPTSLSELKSYSMVSEDEDVVSTMSMMNRLIDANNLVLASLMMAYQEAEQATEIGLSNFLQDRVAAHQKHGWMLKSITK